MDKKRKCRSLLRSDSFCTFFFCDNMSVTDCPECHSSLERYPKQDIPGATERYRCRNKHLIGVDVKTRRVTSIILPFEDLKTCPEKDCGLPVTKVSDQIGETRTKGAEDGSLVRLVHYVCPRGHQSQKRQIIKRNIGEASG